MTQASNLESYEAMTTMDGATVTFTEPVTPPRRQSAKLMGST